MATILIVEDNPATRELLVEFLEADGYTVLEAGTGLEALTVAAAAAPDLILLDLRLPDEAHQPRDPPRGAPALPARRLKEAGTAAASGAARACRGWRGAAGGPGASPR